MNFKVVSTEIETIKKLTKDVIEITFAVKNSELEIAIKPGQFLSIKFTDKDGKQGWRAYSVLVNEGGNLQLCIKKVPNGKATGWLFELSENEKVEIMLPLGHFGFPDKLKDRIIFLATGTGLVPILALLENLSQQKFSRENFYGKMIFGVRTENDLFYQERIELAMKKLNENGINISAEFWLSRPDENWQGKSGRVTIAIEQEELCKDAQVFVCGNPAMIKDVEKIVLEKKVLAENFFKEGF